MAQTQTKKKTTSRKDSKGHVLRKGECERKKEGRYSYSYTDPIGRRYYIYANDLVSLREMENELLMMMLFGKILQMGLWQK